MRKGGGGMIITLDELKTHLRIESSDEDAYLQSLAGMAEAAAQDFCLVDSLPSPPPEPVRLAVLLMAGHFYANRESGDRQAFETMKWAFESLLWPYRDASKLT